MIRIDFLFTTVWGILIGIVVFSSLALLFCLSRNRSWKYTKFSLFLINAWYCITIILNGLLPDLKIVENNNVIYAVISLLIVTLIDFLYREKTYDL